MGTNGFYGNGIDEWGLDSLVCTSLLRERGWDITALFVDYGQKALTAESSAVRDVASIQGIELHTVAVTVGKDFGQGPIVGRNTALVAIAQMAAKPVHSAIALGIHAGTEYYDCSPTFFQRMSTLVVENSGGKIELLAPLLHWSKSQVVDYAIDRGLPMSETYSCENGTLPPCGECLSCHDRGVFEC